MRITHKTIIVAATVALLAMPMLLLGCPEEMPQHQYTCENGTATAGHSPLADVANCAACDGGYRLEGVACVANAYVCENGTAMAGNAPTAGTAGCAACDGGYRLVEGVACVANAYVCENGTAMAGNAPTAGAAGCAVCDGGYRLVEGACVANDYDCENGTARAGNAPTAGAAGCAVCDGGYRLVGGVACVANDYDCENGTARAGNAPTAGAASCVACDGGYILIRAACAPDTDGDRIVDINDTCPSIYNPTDQTDGHACDDDIDNDNDGLIEIWSLEHLHNMRYDLAGASYKTGAGGAAATTSGAPTAATANCAAATNGVYLCGYELAQSLDFDGDGDGRTWDAATYTLDTDDANATYFPVASADEGGWLPVGSTAPNSASAFGAIFEGNGNTIANLAMRRPSQYGGLFARTDADAQIRNIELTAALVAVSNGSAATVAGSLVGNSVGAVTSAAALDVVVVDSDPNSGMSAIHGGLVGHQQGVITASSASGTVGGGNSGSDMVGGLVGFSQNTIAASHASGAVDGGGGRKDSVGGLVGQQQQHQGAIVASYATGTVDGGEGYQDSVGGLVGVQQRGAITASYASGAVDGGNGGSSRVGGLVGQQGQGTITASYATGTVDGGGGSQDWVGGLVGEQRDTIIASYATGNVDGGAGTGDFVGKVLGIQINFGTLSLRSTYGFGSISGAELAGVSPALPSGVTKPADLTESNTKGCSDPLYTTETACELATKAPGAWTGAPLAGICGPPSTGATDGIYYVSFTTQYSCQSTMKTVGTWEGQWNAASFNTMGAWDFGSKSQAPALRYADYDGTSGTTYACAQFSAVPGGNGASICNTLLPGQGR